MNTEKDNILIERFLNLDLSEVELTMFEKKLENDQELAETLQNYITAENLVDSELITKKELQRKQKWRDILNEKSYNEEEKSNAFSWKKMGAIAASLLLFFSIWQFYKGSNEPNIEVALENAWNKKVGLQYSSFRSAEKDAIQKTISESYNAYNSGKYDMAINLIKGFTISNALEHIEDILLVRALSNYKIGNEKRALSTLDTLANYHTGKKSKTALWYMGIIYLEAGNTQKAEEFIEIPNFESKEIKLKD